MLDEAPGILDLFPLPLGLLLLDVASSALDTLSSPQGNLWRLLMLLLGHFQFSGHSLEFFKAPLGGIAEVLDLCGDGFQDLEQLHVLLGAAQLAEVSQVVRVHRVLGLDARRLRPIGREVVVHYLVPVVAEVALLRLAASAGDPVAPGNCSGHLDAVDTCVIKLSRM